MNAGFDRSSVSYDVELMFETAQSVYTPEGDAAVAVEGLEAGGEAMRVEISWDVYMDVRARVSGNPNVQLHEIDSVSLEILSARPDIADGYMEESVGRRAALVADVVDGLFPDRAARFNAEMDIRLRAKLAKSGEASGGGGAVEMKDQGYSDPFAEAAARSEGRSAPKTSRLSFDVEKGIFISPDAPLSAAVERAASEIRLAEETFGRSMRLSSLGEYAGESALTDLLGPDNSASAKIRETLGVVEQVKGGGKPGEKSAPRVR
jgi:hypothetical protein